jgi:hypothetical protein
MTDGAHLGAAPTRALGTILGDDPQPSGDEVMTAEEMARWVAEAPDNPTPDADGYDDACRLLAKWILAWLKEDPRRAWTPSDGWYEQMKADGYIKADLGISGFQWGYAVNVARRLLELPPAANPAIL